MSHAIALNLSISLADTPISPRYKHLTKLCRTYIVDGFRTDKDTGEIYGKFVALQYQSCSEKYTAATLKPPSARRRWGQPTVITKIDNVVHVDFSTSDNNSIGQDDTVPQRNPKGAGRRSVSTVNPISHLAIELLTTDLGKPHPLWLDNIIFGSCLRAAGQSQNVCNVAMNEVVGTLYLHEFKVETLVTQGTSLRKAQRIIKAARHASHGINNYLRRRPKLLKLYEDAAAVEATVAYSPDHLESYPHPQEAPQHIKSMYDDRDYLAYGKALRAFRLGLN
ncbi:hypothetical protein [Pseudomonas sp. GM25]|uniref:hypothetical protein n=1 Tax=Pseudomonas sp. GM25 TaxID=1144327 RepID=UPI0002704FD1|nr:hypothetical protein [Pseudomonas sp. GM25]EJM25760.1 hypothetical protein PMI24_04108 [Pseudomonas sp. GM25]